MLVPLFEPRLQRLDCRSVVPVKHPVAIRTDHCQILQRGPLRPTWHNRRQQLTMMAFDVVSAVAAVPVAEHETADLTTECAVPNGFRLLRTC